MVTQAGRKWAAREYGREGGSREEAINDAWPIELLIAIGNTIVSKTDVSALRTSR